MAGIFSRVSTARLGWSAAWRMQTGANGRPAGFAKRRFAFVCRVFQHIPDGLVIPVLFAGSRAHASLVETATDLIDRQAFLPDPGKHLLHHACFVKDDVKASFSASFLLVHVAVAIGSITEDPDSPLLCGMAFAA